MFNGAKLKETRMVYGYSRKQLAEQLKITEQAIGQYENGIIQPKFNILVKLNDIFGVSRKYFFSEANYQVLNIENQIAFRNSDRFQRSKVEFEKYYLSELHHYLTIFSKKVSLFLNHLSDIKELVVEDFANHTDDQIEKIALKVRKKLKLSENRHLLTILEQNGVIVLEKNFLNKTDACSVWINKVPYIILSSEQKSFVRRNFDLAHELGHLILHANREINQLEKKEFDLLEAQANLFASHFLLPREEFLKDLQEIKGHISNPDAYISLKQKWKVSIAVLAYRAFKENEMTYQQFRYFNISLNKKNYKTIEPLDLDFTIIRPLRLKKMFEFIFENQLVNLNTFLDTHGLRVKNLAIKFNMEEEFFRKYLERDNVVLDFKF